MTEGETEPVIEPAVKPRRIAMVGCAPSTRNDAPWNEPTWELWSQSEAFHVPRVTRWFELQTIGKLKAEYADYYAWLTTLQAPVHMRKHYDEIPQSIQIQREYFENEYPREFLSSTIAWMMAEAIDQHARGNKIEVMGLWGYDMAMDQEFCVVPETKILTADLRWVPIESVSIGDRVIAFDENPGGRPGAPHNFRQWRCATVEEYRKLTRPCYRLYMADGTTLVSSSEHKWLVFAEHEFRWRRTDQLVTPSHPKNRPTKIVKLLDVWEEERSWDAGYLAAAFDGEGWCCQNRRKECDGISFAIGYSQRENAMSDEVVSIAARLGFDLRASSSGAGYNKDCIRYSICGGRANNLEFLGRIRPRRLLDNFNPEMIGGVHKKDAVAVEKAEYIGEQTVIAIKTSTGTFVAEGFASHNCSQRPGIKFFTWVAQRHGIAVFVPNGSDLAISPESYPFFADNPELAKVRARLSDVGKKEQMARKELNNAEAVAEKLRASLNYFGGAKEQLIYDERRLTGSIKPI